MTASGWSLFLAMIFGSLCSIIGAEISWCATARRRLRERVREVRLRSLSARLAPVDRAALRSFVDTEYMRAGQRGGDGDPLDKVHAAQAVARRILRGSS